MIKKEINMIISSNPSLGAVNVSSDGSSFTTQYRKPIIIPKTAQNVTIEVATAKIWWTIYNLTAGVNDQFYLDDNATVRQVTIPPGLYDRSGLNAALNTQLVNDGAASGLIQLGSSAATGKVTITATAITQTIDFTQTDTFRELIGFDSQTLGPNVAAPFTWFGDNVAAFNQVNGFLIHGTIADDGIPVNDENSQILAEVGIDVRPGSQIVYKPFNPARSSIESFAGTSKNSFRYSLTDENNNAVDTASEYWSARLVIRYMDKIRA